MARRGVSIALKMRRDQDTATEAAESTVGELLAETIVAPAANAVANLLEVAADRVEHLAESKGRQAKPRPVAKRVKKKKGVRRGTKKAA